MARKTMNMNERLKLSELMKKLKRAGATLTLEQLTNQCSNALGRPASKHGVRKLAKAVGFHIKWERKCYKTKRVDTESTKRISEGYTRAKTTKLMTCPKCGHEQNLVMALYVENNHKSKTTSAIERANKKIVEVIHS